MKSAELVIYIHGAASPLAYNDDLELAVTADNAMAEANIKALRLTTTCHLRS